jgi:hypothetical protein
MMFWMLYTATVLCDPAPIAAQSHNGGVRGAAPVNTPGRVAPARADVLPRQVFGGGGGGPGAQPLRGASAAPPETGFRAAALFSQACHGVQEFWSRQMQQHILGEANRAGLSLWSSTVYWSGRWIYIGLIDPVK